MHTAFVDLLCQKFDRKAPLKILPNLGRIFRRPSSLPFHGIQLQFVGFGFLAGQQVLAVDVVVHHEDVRFLIAVITDDNGAGIQPHGFRAVIAPVAGNDLVSASITGADN